MAQELLKHRNYFQVAEGNLEFIRGDIWDVEITQWPLAVYNPGIDLLKKRLKDINISMKNNAGTIDKTIFAQELHQNAGRDIQSGSMVFSFIDKEDQAITFMLNDWLNQIADPDTGFGRHKKELLFEVKVNIFNTLLQKIRYYEGFAGILESTDIPDNPGEKGSDLSDCSMTINFEMIHRKVL